MLRSITLKSLPVFAIALQCSVSAPAALRGKVADVALFYDLYAELANSTQWRQWHEGYEFKPIRVASDA